LPPSRTVIEILETVEPDDEVFEGCRRLAAAGYRLALDDFEWFSGAERFLELASIVKLDVLNCERSRIVELVTECRRFDVQLLAEKVETEQDIEFCLMLGFELFQGYALQQPQHVRGQEIVSSQLGRIELAATILSTELDLLGFERVLEHEPGLAVHLIQLASVGARYGIRRPVRSLRDALVLLGTTRLRRWVALLLLRDSGNIAPEAMATALVRARMCELLATRRRTGAPEQAFTAALLSCIDILTGATEVQTRSLELDPELRAAAFDPGTPLGELIGEVARYQQRCGVSDDDAEPDLDLAAAQAVTWALPYVNSLQAA
jgi:c-di-GMP-related signal transduction protein